MLVELSYILSPNMAKWPTNPAERYESILSISSGDNCNASSVYHHMHNGTHVDASIHFNPNGRKLEEIEIERFYYTNPYVLELTKGENEFFTLEDFTKIEDELKNTDLLLIYSGYSELRNKDVYAFTHGFPVLEASAAMYLRNTFPKLKGIALDVISVDSGVTAADEGFPIHHILLDDDTDTSRALLLYEDVNIKKLLPFKDKIESISAFPVRWENAEAAPVAMVAICKD